MTRSVVLSRTSPGRFVPSVWGITLLAVLFGGATLLPARTALAKKKKSAEPTQQTDEAAPPSEKNEKPAEQAGDVEKPKTILDTSQEAPKTDSLGHVHFGSPNAEGVGRVAVKAAPESKIKVYALFVPAYRPFVTSGYPDVPPATRRRPSGRKA